MRKCDRVYPVFTRNIVYTLYIRYNTYISFFASSVIEPAIYYILSVSMSMISQSCLAGGKLAMCCAVLCCVDARTETVFDWTTQQNGNGPEPCFLLRRVRIVNYSGHFATLLPLVLMVVRPWSDSRARKVEFVLRNWSTLNCRRCFAVFGWRWRFGGTRGKILNNNNNMLSIGWMFASPFRFLDIATRRDETTKR